MTKAKWGVFGGDNLIGKEIRDLMEQRRLPATLHLYASLDPEERILTRDEDGEVAVMEPLTGDDAASLDVLLLAASADENLRAWTLTRKVGQAPVVVDLTGSLEGVPGARLRAPLEEEGTGLSAVAGPEIMAHPAALALSQFFRMLAEKWPISTGVATVLEPVSAQGEPGIDELHKQTVALLNFQSIPQAVFDSQVSFNLLPRFGDEAKGSFQQSGQRLERQLEILLRRRGIPAPSVRLIHAPVFHGYTMSVWVELQVRPPVDEVFSLFREGGVDVRGADVEPPSNLAVAGQSGLIVGEISEDRVNANGMWFWIASDNIRTLAENALLVAGLAGRKPS